MRAHLPFSPEEMEWRLHHLTLTVPIHHLAFGPKRMQNIGDGWDISSYQPAGIDFTGGGRKVAAFKATEGLTYFDPHFWANRKSAHTKEADLYAIIMYHFARPSTSSGGTQARYMLSKIGPRQNKEIIALDFEVSPWSVQWQIDFLDVIINEGHYPTEFYTYLGMASANSTAGLPETGTGYWPAAYGLTEPGDDRWVSVGGKDGWQHTDGSGVVRGNDGPYDCSHWDLVKLANRVGSSTPTPKPPEPAQGMFIPVFS